MGRQKVICSRICFFVVVVVSVRHPKWLSFPPNFCDDCEWDISPATKYGVRSSEIWTEYPILWSDRPNPNLMVSVCCTRFQCFRRLNFFSSIQTGGYCICRGVVWEPHCMHPDQNCVHIVHHHMFAAAMVQVANNHTYFWSTTENWIWKFRFELNRC